MKKESVFVMLLVLFVLGGSGTIVPVCAAAIGAGPGTPCEDMDIVFIMDCSGSMATPDAEVGGIPTSRMNAAKVAAKDFIDLLPIGTNTRVGVVSYESYGNAAIEQPLTTAFAVAKTAIDGLSAGGWTATGEGLTKGKEELTAHGNTNRRVFLLLTDGLANRYPGPPWSPLDPLWSPPAGWVSPPGGTWNTAELYAFVEAQDAMTLDVTNPTKIYAIGVGAVGGPNDVNEEFLEVLAHSSGGEYFHYTKATSEMFDEVQADICYGDIRVLILSNLGRMDDLGMDLDTLASGLQDLADNNPNDRGVVVDLGDLCDPFNAEYNAAIDTAYSNWDGHEGDVALTNDLVAIIDDYIEDLKQTTYPLMRYVIIVGSHEIIPMEARPDDYSFVTPTVTYNEKQWAADSLPLTSGYLYDLYHAGADGHYMTDTPYSDLSYLDTSTDHKLTPEISVSRLVETPQQIVGVIDTYMAANGIIQRNDFVSIASYDYLDGGTLASDYMTATGVSTDDSLVQSSFSSLDVPPLLNAKHDVVYFAGHGEYNIISTYSGSFMAGNSATQGDTDATNSVDGAVIITAGCHNGVNFGNMLYHAPDAGTTYSEFPEEFAENGVVAYIGATGYTVISGSGSSTTTSFTGYNEKLATNVVYYTVNCVDIGRAFRNGANDYYVESSPIQNLDRRVLAIPTLYGIPTYRDPVTPESAQAPGRTPATGTDVTRVGAAAGLPEIVTVDVSEYIVESSGIITVPGVEQVVSFNKPILPQVFVERTFPRGSEVSVEWLEDASEYVVIKNDVPIAGITRGNVSIPGKFYYQEFWPLEPHRIYQSLTFGAGGSEVGFVAYPIQYNIATGETKIWTRMKFSVDYKVRPTGISVVRLYPYKPSYSPDKPSYPQDTPLYSSDDLMKLNMGISSLRHTSLMNLGVIMRDMDTGKEIATMELGSIGLEGGTTTNAEYVVDLGSIPPNMLEGRTVAAELIVSDSHNGDILASKGFEFEVAGKPRIYFSTEEDFVTRGPEPADGIDIISDGDLLCSDGTVFARNRELLKAFKTEVDLGLDASDVIDEEKLLVAFSTELDDPKGRFTAGDLLATNGAVLPNNALLIRFDLEVTEEDMGLDAVQFVGDALMILEFLEYVAETDDLLKERPELLPDMLKEFGIDIWFSTEGTSRIKDPAFLDGDLLSARDGIIVAGNSILLPASVPAGIPDRGVDFGLDAVVSDRNGNEASILFSTEILHEGKFCFTDGDLLLRGNGIVHANEDLTKLFKPRADFLGLDAISHTLHEEYPIDSSYPTTTIGPGISIVPTDEKPPKIFFSIEEEFVTQGPEPADGNPIISDGDLLCFQTGCTVFARNRELLKAFDTEVDLGLDAVDVIYERREPLVAFSTELDDPKDRFTAGDLLATNGAVIPNSALLTRFDLKVKEEDLGLDAVHFTGEKKNIASFLEYVAENDVYLHDPEALPELLKKYEIDIWFSTEGTLRIKDPTFLDGDLLSARDGTIVSMNSVLLPASVPAGIPSRGVDFGLDAATTDRNGNKKLIRFSTEILYRGWTCFTDGDILRANNGVTHTNGNLISGFEPKARFLGLDALSIAFEGMPDLVIKDIRLKNAGRVCYVNYRIANIGASDASASTTYLSVAGKRVAKDITGALAPGAVRWDTFKYSVTRGTHRLKVCADGPDAIDETSEINNCRTERLRCPPYTRADMTIALRMVVGASPPTREADVNGDGVVNSLDTLMMLQRIASN